MVNMTFPLCFSSLRDIVSRTLGKYTRCGGRKILRSFRKDCEKPVYRSDHAA